MFQGFTDETFEFFMAIAFNNNTDFFHANHDWYLRAAREPCLQLAAALSEAVEALDAAIERRPNRVVSRINRDLRFTRDKSPYRDHLWLGFHRPGAERYAAPGLYFEITAKGACYGMGYYEEDRARMNGLRRRLRTEPEAFLSRWRSLEPDYEFYLTPYKRMKLPENLDPAVRGWYPVRTFYINRNIHDMDLLRSPALADHLAGEFARFAPFYQYLAAIAPEPDETETKELPRSLHT